MLSIIEEFLSSLLTDFINYITDGISDSLTKICFHMEKYIGEDLSSTIFDTSAATSLIGVVTKFGVALITLKLLKKGFDHYVTYAGEPDYDPVTLLFNYGKALAVAICFPTLYNYISKIVEEFLDAVLEATTFSETGIGSLTSFAWVTGGGIITIIFGIVYFVCFIKLYMQFIMRGMEIFIVRCGVPLACVGMIDSNGGIWTGYIAKLIQAMTTAVVQLFLYKLSIVLYASTHIFWAIAAISLAIKTPRLISELIIPAQQGGGKLNSVYYATNMVRQVVSRIKN